MHISTGTRLTEFGERHPDAARPLRDWAQFIRRKRYRGHLELRADFPRADFSGARTVVFDICGTRYRLVVDKRYGLGRACIRHVTTRQAYDRVMKRGRL